MADARSLPGARSWERTSSDEGALGVRVAKSLDRLGTLACVVPERLLRQLAREPKRAERCPAEGGNYLKAQV